MSGRHYVVAIGLLACWAAMGNTPAYEPVTDNPALPRVLLIGDSISVGYTVPVRRLLEGKANVHRPPENCESTTYGLQKIKDWLGEGQWDVIHFNWGIWDTHHLADGSVRTSPERYKKNLRELVSILKATKAKLIWSASTPLETRRHGDLTVQERDIPVYNAVAAKVMRETKVPTDDLYADVQPRIGELRSDDGCHYTPAGYEFLAERVAESISKALGISRANAARDKGEKRAGCAADMLEGPAYRQTQNVVYCETDGVGFLMDVFTPVKPDGPAQGLGIVCVASGGWASDRFMVDAYGKLGTYDVLCGRGFTVFAVRPGSAPPFTAEEMLEHLRTGIRYIKARAADYGIDPNRLGMFGVSAGGHLACLAAMRAEPGDSAATDPLRKLDSQVKAVAVFCPATDFLDWNGQNEVLMVAKGHLAFRDVPANPTEEQLTEVGRAMSPVYQIEPGLPPFWFVHGDTDTVIPVQQSKKLAKALRDAGNSAELNIRPGANHAWPTMRDDIVTAATWFESKLAPSGHP